MILTCPSCKTRYLVDANALGARGRHVRCAKCGETWHQEPPADMPLQLEVPLPPSFTQPPTGEAKLPALVRRRQANPGLVATLGVLILAGLAAFAYYGRPWLVAQWPAVDRIYAVLGIAQASTIEGLRIEGARVERVVDGDVQVLVVTGAIVNGSNVIRAVPRLRGAFRDAAMQEIGSWTFTPAGEPLKPGQRLPFQDRFRDPPEGAADVTVKLDAAS